MRKPFILPLTCAMSAMLATGCAASGDPEQAKPFFAGMPNPFIEVSDLRSAADLAGFPVSFGGKCSGNTVIRVIKGSLVEIICFKGNNELYRVRKGAGTGEVSGDYSVYQITEEKQAVDLAVTLKGNDGKSWSLATWRQGNYSYSASPAAPLGTSEILDLAQQLR